ncbi:putative phage abortive infection protein [Flavobacterium gyeonganense]|uniref:Phage abortive infection protein n=1 Tax=Flavobacterium gyeonganense TaxID=1310418 RepID=A0ABV5HDU3_9FLAO|nr:putative phage abortive infection protein [Flavobacterium gyeonganense]
MDFENEPEAKYVAAKKILRWGVIVLLLAVLFIGFVPKIITEWSIIGLEVTDANEIGDALGGILGPIVGLIGVGLTFLAFWAQYDANIEQRRQFGILLRDERTQRLKEEERRNEEKEHQDKEFLDRQKQFYDGQERQQHNIMLQDIRSRINLFESRFHTMMTIHRDNVNSIEVNGIRGRKVFIHMLDELKLFYKLFSDINSSNPHETLSDDALYNIAYLTFFFGAGEKSTPMVKDLVVKKHEDFVEKAHKVLKEQIESNKNEKTIIFKTKLGELVWKKHYSLGTGHLRRLGHYFRHLFQIVKFVDEQHYKLIKQEEKYKYVSSLRSQLTAHEQILLFYNAVSVMGQPWLKPLNGNQKENYIERYCMLRSMPLIAVDFYKAPLDVFDIYSFYGKPMFEWAEIKIRIKEI